MTVSTDVVAHDLRVTLATVNQQSVLVSGGSHGDGVVSSPFTLEYVTGVNDTAWPWRGLDIHVVVVDSGGLESTLVSRQVPGSVFRSSPLSEVTPSVYTLSASVDLDGDGDRDVVFGTWNASDALVVLMNDA